MGPDEPQQCVKLALAIDHERGLACTGISCEGSTEQLGKRLMKLPSPFSIDRPGHL